MGSNANWIGWALGSASFAALTAIFAKLGVSQVNSDLATFIRTIVILLALAVFLTVTGQWQPLGTVGGKAWAFLVLSGLATGASWLCYFKALKLGDAARVAPVDKLSVILVAVFGVMVLGERLSATNWLGIVLVGGGVLLLTLRA
jgi:transporter family protein